MYIKIRSDIVSFSIDILVEPSFFQQTTVFREARRHFLVEDAQGQEMKVIISVSNKIFPQWLA
jgi:hypothetical protein